MNGLPTAMKMRAQRTQTEVLLYQLQNTKIHRYYVVDKVMELCSLQFGRRKMFSMIRKGLSVHPIGYNWWPRGNV